MINLQKVKKKLSKQLMISRKWSHKIKINSSCFDDGDTSTQFNFTFTPPPNTSLYTLSFISLNYLKIKIYCIIYIHYRKSIKPPIPYILFMCLGKFNFSYVYLLQIYFKINHIFFQMRLK